MLNSPSAIRQALVGEARKLGKGLNFGRAKRLIGNGLVMSEGESHHRQRRLMQPAFHRAEIARYVATMRDVAVPRISAWPDGGTLALDREMRSVTLTVLTRTLLSSDIGADAIDEIERLLRVLLSELVARGMTANVPGLAWVPTRSNRRFSAANRRLRALLTGIIDGYRRAEADHGDLISILMRAHDDDTGAGMTNKQLRDEATTLVIAGSETTGNTIAWACCLLAQHPQIQERLQEEADLVLDGTDASYESSWPALTWLPSTTGWDGEHGARRPTGPAALPGGVLLPAVAAGAAPGGQAHDGRRGFQAELAEHAGGVFLVPDLGELAVAGAEDLLPGHGDRTTGRREPEQVEYAGVGAGHGPPAGHEVAVRHHDVGGEPQVGKRPPDHGDGPVVPFQPRWLAGVGVVVDHVVGHQLAGYVGAALLPDLGQPAPVHRLKLGCAHDRTILSLRVLSRGARADNHVICRPGPAGPAAVDHLPARPADGTQPGVDLAPGHLPAVRGAEEASGRRAGHQPARGHRPAPQHRVQHHPPRPPGAGRMAGRTGRRARAGVRGPGQDRLRRSGHPRRPAGQPGRARR